MKAQLTQKEKAVLESIPASEFICLEKNDLSVINLPTWTFTCEDSGIKGKALSGVISSLTKKGFVGIENEPSEGDSIWLTKKGFEAIN
jgi:hypothetical protein